MIASSSVDLIVLGGFVLAAPEPLARGLGSRGGVSIERVASSFTQFVEDAFRAGGAVNASRSAATGADAYTEFVGEAETEAAIRGILALEPEGEPIEHAARVRAAEIVRTMEPQLFAERIIADPDGGVAIYAFGEATIESGARRRYARIGVANDGAVMLSMSDRVDGTFITREITRDVAGSLQDVADFLNG